MRIINPKLPKHFTVVGNLSLLDADNIIAIMGLPNGDIEVGENFLHLAVHYAPKRVVLSTLDAACGRFVHLAATRIAHCPSIAIALHDDAINCALYAMHNDLPVHLFSYDDYDKTGTHRPTNRKICFIERLKHQMPCTR